MPADYPVIASLQNPKVKNVVRLRHRHERDKKGLFIIEGHRELTRACEGGYPLETLFICPSLFQEAGEGNLVKAVEARGGSIFLCSDHVFRKMSYRDRPDGLLAVAPQTHKNLSDLDKIIQKARLPFLIAAEAIEKPGNLGTILRSSDAVGLDALIVCDKCTDIHNPNVVRASLGTLFTVPVLEAGSEETLAQLRKQNIAIIAATPGASTEYTQADMNRPIAIAVGSEMQGLSDVWMDNAAIKVRIPMLGRADSLNVATATTLLLYEALRQRGNKADLV